MRTKKTKGNEIAIPSIVEVEAGVGSELKSIEMLVAKFKPDFSIENDSEAQMATADLKVIKTTYSQIDEKRKQYTKPLDDTKKIFMNLFRPIEESLSKAENIIKRAILSYQQEQERKARIEAERIRKEQEAIRATEEARLKRQAEEAALMDDDYGEEQAKEALQELEQTPAVIVPSPIPAPKLSGVSTSKLWKCEVTDMLALVKFIAETGQHINLIEANSKDLGTLAKATKGSLSIPGLRFYSEDSLSVRGA